MKKNIALATIFIYCIIILLTGCTNHEKNAILDKKSIVGNKLENEPQADADSFGENSENDSSTIVPKTEMFTTSENDSKVIDYVVLNNKLDTATDTTVKKGDSYLNLEIVDVNVDSHIPIRFAYVDFEGKISLQGQMMISRSGPISFVVDETDMIKLPKVVSIASQDYIEFVNAKEVLQYYQKKYGTIDNELQKYNCTVFVDYYQIRYSEGTGRSDLAVVISIDGEDVLPYSLS